MPYMADVSLWPLSKFGQAAAGGKEAVEFEGLGWLEDKLQKPANKRIRPGSLNWTKKEMKRGV